MACAWALVAAMFASGLGCGRAPTSSDEALGESKAAILDGEPDVNMPVVILRYVDFDRIKNDWYWYYCTGTFIAEHWILTAGHCAPGHFLDPKGQRNFYTPDKPRRFRGKVEQKLSATKPTRCLFSPRSGGSDCELDIEAYPFSTFPDPSTGDEPPLGDDLALWFLPEFFPIGVNKLDDGAALEPERGALPIGAPQRLQVGEELVPWGYGNTDRPAPPGVPSACTEDADCKGWVCSGAHKCVEPTDLRRPPSGAVVKLSSGALREEYIEVTATTAGAKLCHGDSGGPLIRRVGNRDVVVGVNGQVIPASQRECAQTGQPMKWARVDTARKHEWITRTLGLWEGKYFACRGESSDFAECWPGLCRPGPACATGQACRRIGSVSLMGSRASVERPWRCLSTK